MLVKLPLQADGKAQEKGDTDVQGKGRFHRNSSKQCNNVFNRRHTNAPIPWQVNEGHSTENQPGVEYERRAIREKAVKYLERALADFEQ
jgi:hypothetical protein